MVSEEMPIRVMALLIALACAAAYAVPRAQCDVPLLEDCATDTQCECMYGPEEHP